MPVKYIYGTLGTETIYGSDDRDPTLALDEIIYSMGGNDFIYGGGGNDWIWGAVGLNPLFSSIYVAGGAGDDVIVGFNGHDWLQGDAGNDILIAGNGDDTVWGGDGNDQLWGGAGDDKLVGGFGGDILVGGDGNDTIYGFGVSGAFQSAYDHNYIDAGAGNDVIYTSGTKAIVWGGDGADIISVDGEATVYAGTGDDVIHDTRGGYCTYYGAAGDDTYIIDIFGGLKTIVDLEGNNVIRSSSMNGFNVTTGDGNDTIIGGGYIIAGGGDDFITPARNAYVFDGSGNDTINDALGRTVYHMDAGVDSFDLCNVASLVVTERQYTSFRGQLFDLGYSITTTTSLASMIIYDDLVDVGPGNMDTFVDFKAAGAENVYIFDTYNETGRYNRVVSDPIRDNIWYDDALGTDVTWYNDANGDLLMQNGQGIFAKFIGVTASDMNLAFHYF